MMVLIKHKSRKPIIIVILSICILTYVVTMWLPIQWKTFTDEDLYYAQGDYLIDNRKCRIFNINPWNPDAKAVYAKRPPYKCSTKDDLSDIYLTDNHTRAYIKIDENRVPQYTNFEISCCASNVTRKQTPIGGYNDNDIEVSNCIPFYPTHNEIQISNEHPTFVSCKNYLNQNVYQNIHMPIAMNAKISQKLRKSKIKQPLSVLIIGIDSISRLNMIRTLPMTREFLANDPTWLEYKIFQKIGDNTLPNLMAILTGYNMTQAKQKCGVFQHGGKDNCPFIWRAFSKRDYITMYSEDLATISTFNYENSGFDKPPTDYYTRAYHMGCSKLLAGKSIDYTPFCTGSLSDGERVLRLIQSFAQLHQSNSYFGFFWMNSFSHEDVNLPTRMDETVKNYIKNITKQAEENCVIIFLSDHGMRFGAIRNSLTGYIEERLPFLFMKFPKWFQTKYFAEYQNLRSNTEKMVTPFDIHMTLQDILTHADSTYKSRPAMGCPKCHSLMQPINLQRSCQDVNVTEHWCTCAHLDELNPQEDTTVYEASQAVVAKLNDILLKIDVNKDCHTFQFDHVIKAFRTDNELLVILLQTKPKASFEATVHAKKMKVYTGISRSDIYKFTAACTSNVSLKPYCYCKNTNITMP